MKHLIYEEDCCILISIFQEIQYIYFTLKTGSFLPDPYYKETWKHPGSHMIILY